MQAKGISLHIGLNAVDPIHYQGWNGELYACEADAEDMRKLARSRGFTTQSLLTAQATRRNVIDSITDTANKLSSGDIFILSYSGHGGQLPNSKEIDGQDETWCLYDAQLIDNELYRLLGLFKIGVRVLVFSDSCHSGTVTKPDAAIQRKFETGTMSVNDDSILRSRNMPKGDANSVYFANKSFYDAILNDDSLADTRNQVHASVLLLSGCRDEQLSRENAFHGLFTGRLLRVWQDGLFSGDYKQFHDDILKGMPKNQTPNYCPVGVVNSAFEGQVPFTIDFPGSPVTRL